MVVNSTILCTFSQICYTRSSSRYAALLLGPCAAGRARLVRELGGLRPHGSPVQISQICYGKSPSAGQPWSCLILSSFPKFVTENHPQPASPDRVWSCPDFPNLLRKIPPQLAIFRNKFGKPWSCLILSRPDRVWSWSECNNSSRREGEKDKTYFYGFRLGLSLIGEMVAIPPWTCCSTYPSWWWWWWQ